MDRSTPTVTLDGVVRDTAQHGEPALLAEVEPLLHPREEMRERKVAPTNALWNARRATRERQSADAVRSERDVERFARSGVDGSKDVAGGVLDRGGGSEDQARVGQLQGRNFDPDRELLGDVLPNGREELARRGENDERSRLSDLEVDRLPSGRVRGVYIAGVSVFFFSFKFTGKTL